MLEDGPFVVVNGKLITDIDLNAAVAEHRQRNALATLVLRRNEKFERFSFVEVRDGLVQRFAGMPSRDSWPGNDAPLMFTGIHIIEPRLFDYIPREVFSDSVIDVYPPAIAKGERIVGHVAEGTWYELSTLQRYLDISLALMRADDKNVYAGANSSIAEGANVREAILWDGVTIAAGASVERSVVGDGVKIKPGESLQNAVVVRADLVAGRKVPAKALSGQIKGENFVVCLSQ
jgi:NDP-sugar pyrophosphorylase family protein